MSLISREDVLRELELLPVWQLRMPFPSQVGPEFSPMITAVSEVEPPALTIEKALPINVEQITVDVVATQVLDAEETLQVETLAIVDLPAVESDVMPQLYAHILNDDGDWLFVLPNTALQADETRLLQNIFMAMRIKSKPAENSSNIADVINTTQPKLVVAMGEATAQAMLQSTEKLSSLRGTLQQFQGVALVATYDLSHLLQMPLDKAKVWDDLCLAMQILQAHK